MCAPFLCIVRVGLTDQIKRRTVCFDHDICAIAMNFSARENLLWVEKCNFGIAAAGLKYL